MIQEQLKSDNQNEMEPEPKPDELPELFFPETVADLFSRPGDNHYLHGFATASFFKHLMSGFTALNHGMLVTLLDKKHNYQSAESYFLETMHPFCACLRGERENQCRMKEACLKFDRMVANTILDEKQGYEQYLVPVKFILHLIKKFFAYHFLCSELV